jgi:hypothetical protein
LGTASWRHGYIGGDHWTSQVAETLLQRALDLRLLSHYSNKTGQQSFGSSSTMMQTWWLLVRRLQCWQRIISGQRCIIAHHPRNSSYSRLGQLLLKEHVPLFSVLPLMVNNLMTFAMSQMPTEHGHLMLLPLWDQSDTLKALGRMPNLLDRKGVQTTILEAISYVATWAGNERLHLMAAMMDSRRLAEWKLATTFPKIAYDIVLMALALVWHELTLDNTSFPSKVQNLDSMHSILPSWIQEAVEGLSLKTMAEEPIPPGVLTSPLFQQQLSGVPWLTHLRIVQVHMSSTDLRIPQTRNSFPHSNELVLASGL